MCVSGGCSYVASPALRVAVCIRMANKSLLNVWINSEVTEQREEHLGLNPSSTPFPALLSLESGNRKPCLRGRWQGPCCSRA